MNAPSIGIVGTAKAHYKAAHVIDHALYPGAV